MRSTPRTFRPTPSSGFLLVDREDVGFGEDHRILIQAGDLDADLHRLGCVDAHPRVAFRHEERGAPLRPQLGPARQPSLGHVLENAGRNLALRCTARLPAIRCNCRITATPRCSWQTVLSRAAEPGVRTGASPSRR